MADSPKPREPSSSDVPGAQALVRGLDVLMAIGAAPAPLRFGELQDAVKIPKGSLHRLLAALQSRGLVRFEEHGRRYALGSRVFDLARRTMDQSSLIRAAKPELSRLARHLRRACCLYVLEGEEVFVLDFEDPDAAQTRVVRVWPRLPAHGSSPGFAIAANSPADADKEAPNSGAISQARALGYAISQDNCTAVAAAILDSGGYPVGAICCHVDSQNEGAELLHEAGRLVREAAARASGNVSIADHVTEVAAQPKTTDPAVTVLDTGRDFMGENPVWCQETNKVWWLDVLAPALRSRNLVSGETRHVILDDLTGGLALTQSGKLLLAGRQGIHLFDVDSETSTLLFDPEKHKPENRFNSASVDSAGNLWVGTMRVDGQSGSGSLYKIGPDLSVQTMLGDVTLPKNADWSMTGDEVYLSQGGDARLDAYSFTKDGTLGDPRLIVQGNADIGRPNGIAVDDEGCIWVAMMGGWSVNRYAPDGELLRKIALPVPMPTALSFGGPNLDKLFVTSTYLRMPAGYSSLSPQAGNLIVIDTGVTGRSMLKFGI
ncbi:SMP-30/gluconolactonase/LRE family protein [Sulfitobacter mediterraneus]|uniref:SMP-30/gluconolactonase/LRE family protein n=1 Tax=Sulfitobacter mediterraneus TaxID=83219 RepID=UPI0021A8DDD8|nr:SMP-30/gluconolactonase/LRE family protein [Sulfitobacter mediterraneus]UWR13444.1 SMP-30/gluconolactonase/LRE family protein [Sulfitobacter mediterraneus]